MRQIIRRGGWTLAVMVAAGLAVRALNAQQATPRKQPGADITKDYEMHFMVTQGMRDRKTLQVMYPNPNKKSPAGEVNPASQQIDFYIRSPETEQGNNPARKVFTHFFGMEVTWK